MTTPEMLLAVTLIIFSAWCVMDMAYKRHLIRDIRRREAMLHRLSVNDND